MERRRIKKRSKTNDNVLYYRNRICFFFILIFYCSISARISVSSSSVVSVERNVKSYDKLRDRLSTILLRRHTTTSSFGFYYGIPSMLFESDARNKKVTGSDTKVMENYDDDEVSLSRRKYLERYESIGRDVEKWAERMLLEGNFNEDNRISDTKDKDDWTEVFCAKAFRSKFNNRNSNSVPTTRQWVKWMKDSRQQYAEPGDKQKHPCMRLEATIEAPFNIVCRYLSEKKNFREYNSLLVDQADVEILTPHSKICWSQSKKLLFIQPRDFVTYCRHRWLNDGTQLITNQACDDASIAEQIPSANMNGALSGVGRYRAFSLRGATYISKCPDFPEERTKLVMLSHCNCGRDVPEWAVRAAVAVLAPIKPFEIIHRIREGVRRGREDLERAETESNAALRISTEKTSDHGRSCRPAGMAQMGYACFWPEGGGLVDRST